MSVTSGQEPWFADRVEAGRVLARQLEGFRHGGALVLGVPRGGVVVAAEVARHLGLDLDVVVARKLGAPGAQELGIGAVAADGERYLNRRLIARLGVSEVYVDAVTTAQLHEAQRRERFLRGDTPAPSVAGRTVIVVDDGLATGATVRAACQSLRRGRPAKLVVAVPVAAAPTCAELRNVADEVICPYELDDMAAIGRYYREFYPVEDHEVKAILDQARAHPAATATG